jgi:ribosomal protein L40E
VLEKPILEAVARILGLIAAPPYLRSQPQPGDRTGPFTQWFDGGAISTVTGYTAYEFTDGTRALVPTPFSHILIQLPGGEQLTLSLDKTLPAQPVASEPVGALICPQCSQRNNADARFCSECGTILTPPVSSPAVPAALETIPPASETSKKCSHCGAANKARARFCLACGKRLALVTAPMTGGTPPGAAPPMPSPAANEKICAKCQSANTPAAHFCRSCGAALS